MEKTELFSHLANQIKLPENIQQTHFLNAEVQEVVVHAESRKWTFHLQIQELLPFEVFQAFLFSMNKAFSDIAQIEVVIKSLTQKVTDKNLGDYWQYVVNNSGITSPLVQELCEKATPFMLDGRVTIMAENGIVENFLKTQALGPIEEAYQRTGFPKFQINTFVDESASQEKIDELNKKQEAHRLELSKAAAAQEKQKAAVKAASNDDDLPSVNGPVQIGRPINPKEVAKQMVTIDEEERSVVLEGYLFDSEIRTLRTNRDLLQIKITDYSSSFAVKKFSNNDEERAMFAALKPGMWVRVRGRVQEDNYLRDLVVFASDIQQIPHQERQDTAPADKKRVELHLHSNMSQMDATNSISDFVAQAAKWGQKAIAITDHAAAQSFPDAYAAGKKHGVKILYGIEANMVDDGVPIAYNLKHIALADETYVIFDVETTGLSAVYDKVIELAAVKMQNGNVIDEFDAFIDPGFKLSAKTTELTSITDEMVHGSKTEAEVLADFKAFSAGTTLVAHNATFDMGFLNTGYGRNEILEADNPVIDTLELARFLFPDFGRHTLNALAKRFDINLEHHHRANSDAETTGNVLYVLLKEGAERYQINYHDELNSHMGENNAWKQARPFHATLLATTQEGLKRLFMLVSKSMVDYFYRVPRIPRSVLNENREGIIVGSACSSGEVFEAIMQKGYDEAKEKAKYYDYLELQPKIVYQPLIEDAMIRDNTDLEKMMKQIVQIGEELNKPVVATGDVHYMNEEDAVYRKILVNAAPGANPFGKVRLPKVHFRTTNEMLDDFAFLGDKKAEEIVVTNSQKIADIASDLLPVKDKLYTPKMPGSEDEIRKLSYDKAHELYGEELPEIIEKRLERELTSIIGNGFSVIYLIAQKLVFKSNKDGYLVGSRGSVGSSLVATMTGITEVNPMPPHYRCPKCHYTEFFTKGEVGSGFDLADKNCPTCGTSLKKDGHDIPFETFLGFHGDKVPDIDLNFSGDYQPFAHNYTKVLFGEDYVYRAGTIGTVADKTAFGYVKAFERDTNQTFRQAEIDRLAKGTTGVKRTTGQHPGGIIVIPDYMDVYDFTPIQYPADDVDSTWRTTHFDFHSIHDNILKLDILGHDDPTMIRMLQDLSGIDPKTIPTDDPGVMGLFSGTDTIGVTEEQIQSKTGTLGIPEFGTKFVRGMLEETNPTTFAELLQISGLSHGTDVWLGNAEELIRDGTVTLKDVIGCRDDIMMYLIHHGLDAGMAFQIMEHVRKGKGIPDEWQDAMHDQQIPQWYINSCLKIKYMFPKAHATAYILMALRVAYFKVYFPVLYYCAYLSVRATDFDVVAMSRGKDAIKAVMKDITDKGNDASTKEKNLLTVLEITNEMVERGIDFKMVDIDKSDASDFLIEGDTLIAPFRSIPGLGMNVAKQIVSAREERPFLSKEDLATRGKVSKTTIEFLTENGVLSHLPDENQLSLFDGI